MTGRALGAHRILYPATDATRTIAAGAPLAVPITGRRRQYHRGVRFPANRLPRHPRRISPGLSIFRRTRTRNPNNGGGNIPVAHSFGHGNFWCGHGNSRAQIGTDECLSLCVQRRAQSRALFGRAEIDGDLRFGDGADYDIGKPVGVDIVEIHHGVFGDCQLI